jgi:hypothetical protein
MNQVLHEMLVVTTHRGNIACQHQFKGGENARLARSIGSMDETYRRIKRDGHQTVTGPATLRKSLILS